MISSSVVSPVSMSVFVQLHDVQVMGTASSAFPRRAVIVKDNFFILKVWKRQRRNFQEGFLHLDIPLAGRNLVTVEIVQSIALDVWEAASIIVGQNWAVGTFTIAVKTSFLQCATPTLLPKQPPFVINRILPEKRVVRIICILLYKLYFCKIVSVRRCGSPYRLKTRISFNVEHVYRAALKTHG